MGCARANGYIEGKDAIGDIRKTGFWPVIMRHFHEDE
jgi:hypothetical protein